MKKKAIFNQKRVKKLLIFLGILLALPLSFKVFQWGWGIQRTISAESQYSIRVNNTKMAEENRPYTDAEKEVLCQQFLDHGYTEIPFMTLEEAGYPKDFFNPFIDADHSLKNSLGAKFYDGKIVVKTDYNNDGVEDTLFKFFTTYMGQNAFIFGYLDRKTNTFLTFLESKRYFGTAFLKRAPIYTYRADRDFCFPRGKKFESPEITGSSWTALYCYYTKKNKDTLYSISPFGSGQKFIKMNGKVFLVTYYPDVDYYREDIQDWATFEKSILNGSMPDWRKKRFNEMKKTWSHLPAMRVDYILNIKGINIPYKICGFVNEQND